MNKMNNRKNEKLDNSYIFSDYSRSDALGCFYFNIDKDNENTPIGNSDLLDVHLIEIYEED